MRVRDYAVVLFAAGALIMAATTLLSCAKMACSFRYVMPDGARCVLMEGPITNYKFSGCNTGKTYLNPVWYSVEYAPECTKK